MTGTPIRSQPREPRRTLTLVALTSLLLAGLASPACSPAAEIRLEQVADGLVRPVDLVTAPGDTRIFIRPPYEFRAVDRLITNFHLPRSTLMMLVAAFAGYDLTMRAYQEAVAERYRLYSYGDAMVIVKD